MRATNRLKIGRVFIDLKLLPANYPIQSIPIQGTLLFCLIYRRYRPCEDMQLRVNVSKPKVTVLIQV